MIVRGNKRRGVLLSPYSLHLVFSLCTLIIMFSFKKKPKADDTQEAPHVIRTSPSLPALAAQGIPWPEDLVDISSLNAIQPPQHRKQGATRTSLHSSERSPIAFHKPLWLSFPGTSAEPQTTGSISKLYVSTPPSAFETRKTPSYGRATRPASAQRRARVPSTSFNIMVCWFYRLESTAELIYALLSRLLELRERAKALF